MPKDGKPFAKDAIPVDVSKLSLFSSMYVNAALRNSMFLWEHYNFLWWKLLWAFTGSSVGFNQFVGSVPQDNMHVSKCKLSIFLCRSSGIGISSLTLY